MYYIVESKKKFDSVPSDEYNYRDNLAIVI
jgi:hypothetical protein